MKPLLAHTYEPHRVTYPCYVQPKLNGIRALYQNGSFQSRDQLPFPSGLLAHLAEPLKEIFGPEVILDGELYVHGWPLQRINAAVTPVRQTPTEDTLRVEYHVFDRVDFTQPFAYRHHAGPIQKQVVGVTTQHVQSAEEADYYYAHWVASGYEGMMYRLGDCPYTVPKQTKTVISMMTKTLRRTKFLSDKDNRCWHLLKRKDWQDDEFECVGVAEGEGKYQGTLGAVVCRTKRYQRYDSHIESEFKNHFNVGSGLTDAERDHFWANPPIGRLVKVKYLVLSEAGIPLNPTILAIL